MSDSLDAPGSDRSTHRRDGARKLTLKSARIVFNGGYSSYDCVVRNLSALGANLSVSATTPIPGNFELRFADDHLPARMCTVVWKSATRIGVKFQGSANDGTIPANGKKLAERKPPTIARRNGLRGQPRYPNAR